CDAGLGNDDVFDVLDLCLECRACKAECPVGVDVARFKSEFLADYWRRQGLPMRARAIGRIHTLSTWGSRLAPVSNAVAQSLPARWLGERLFGIDRRRTLPAWSRQTFRSRFARECQTPGSAGVILFCDTFTNHNHPQVGIDAAHVLEAAGLSPRLVPHGCCGRPLISQGLLDEARRLANENADALYASAAA